MKKIFIAIILSLFFATLASADHLTCDPQDAGVVSKYKINLNGKIFDAGIETVGTNEVRIYYDIDHLGNGKYIVIAAAGNDKGEWSAWSEELLFYRGAPVPQFLNLCCASENSVRISQKDLKVYYVSSEEIVKVDKPAINVLDENKATIWVSKWVEKHPHEIQIDLGQTYNVSRLDYLPRQDSGRWGMIQKYEIYVSKDSAVWTKIASGEFIDSKDEQVVNFNPCAAKYISLIALSEFDIGTRASVAEINIWGN